MELLLRNVGPNLRVHLMIQSEPVPSVPRSVLDSLVYIYKYTGDSAYILVGVGSAPYLPRVMVAMFQILQAII